ncbi:MAG: LamG domain-containing protein, partial [Verrucomicrobiaceae bacterium]
MKPYRHVLLPVSFLIVTGDCGAELVAHYKFDEAAAATTALNEVAAGTTGAVGSAVVTGVEGIAGNAYSFGGATANQIDIVDMADASFFPAINASGRYSFSTWVKTADTTGNRNCVIFAGDNTQANVYADLGVAAGQVGFLGAASARNRPVGANAAQQTGVFSSPAVPPVNDDAWHHLVMTMDVASSRLELWVDGVLTNTQSAISLPVFNNFEIGRLGRLAPVDPYQGLVDDVQVYDHVLTPLEISFLKKFPGESYADVDTDLDGLSDPWERV